MSFIDYQPHALFCKKLLGDGEYCDRCIHDSFLLANTKEIHLNTTIPLPKNFNLDKTHFMIPSNSLSLSYKFQYMYEPYSLSIYHRKAISPNKNYEEVYQRVLKNTNNLSMHFIDFDINLIRKFSLFAVIAFMHALNPDFVFTPELGYRIAGSSSEKINWMIKIGSELGKIYPICLMFPAWYPSDIQKFSKKASILQPALIGIYCGGRTKFKTQLKNIKALRKIYPEKEIFCVSVSHPEKIRSLIKAGANHFVINSWGQIGTKIKVIDPETYSFSSGTLKILDSCECSACGSYEQTISQKSISSEKNKNLKLILHNICGYKELVEVFTMEEV